MKIRSIVLAVIVAILALAMSGSGQQSAEQLFKTGLYEEEVGGDLQKAIGIYQDLLKRFPASREAAAKAQLHIGVCYEKLGGREAEKAFQKVIDNYPDQAEMVRQAKDRIALLGGSRTVAGPDETSFKLRQVWAGPGVDTCGAVSPDGRYLSFIDWGTGDLAIRELATGANRRLTDKGSWAQSPEFALFSRWSADGQYIVYQWYTKDETYELRIVDIKNSRSRTLLQSQGKNVYVHPFDWSPNGKSVLAGVYRMIDGSVQGVFQLSLISVDDGSVNVLKTQQGIDPAVPKVWGFAFSPDGKYIAYDVMQEEKAYDIFLIPTDGGAEVPLIDHPAVDQGIDWTPDGQGLLFTSDRTGTQDVWLIRVAGGKPQGDPQLLKSGVGRIEPMGITSGGGLYYGLAGGATDVYEVGIDPRTGKIVSPVKRTVLLFEGHNECPDFSPDGKQLAYMSVPGMPTVRPRRVLNILSLESGQVRELNPKLVAYNYPRWAPDGRSISVEGIRPDTQIGGIYGVDVQTAAVTPIVQAPKGTMVFSHRRARDGRSIYYTLGDRDEKACSVLVRDLESGRDDKLAGAPENAHDIDISRDGRWLALMNRRGTKKIWIMPATGGEPREIYAFEQEGSRVMTPAWSADGRYVYFSKLQKSPGALLDLYRVSVEDGKAEKLDLAMTRLRHISVHPDGQRIAFSSMGANPDQSQIWVMENFLPSGKK